MKNLITSSIVALGILLTAALVMTSCIKERSSGINTLDAGKPATVAFNIEVTDPVTRSYPGDDEWDPAHGNLKDRVISSFRVLVYEAFGAAAGKLRWNMFALVLRQWQDVSYVIIDATLAGGESNWFPDKWEGGHFRRRCPALLATRLSALDIQLCCNGQT